MTLSDVAIRRGGSPRMMSVTLLLWARWATSSLGTDLYPDVTLPAITVTVVYPGASPQDARGEVVTPRRGRRLGHRRRGPSSLSGRARTSR
jgi:multidrug efflux pump subunit AcrB